MSTTTTPDRTEVARRERRSDGSYLLHGDGATYVVTRTTREVYKDVPASDRIGGTRPVLQRGWVLRAEGHPARDGEFYPTLTAAAEFVGTWYGRG